MAGKQYPLSVVIQAVDKLTAPMRRINNSISQAFRPVRQLQASLSSLSRESGLYRVASQANNVKDAMGGVARAGVGIGAAFAGLGYLFKTQLVDTASEFERFQTILETVEGSAGKARMSMDWVAAFAARTPYEIGEVTDSFVKLRAYGMEPTNGLLATLGDTAAAMGKPIMQAVEAVADAVTGENERLKEFGIKARKQGKDFLYEYTANGKTMTKKAKANSREQIQATLQAIWNERYAGAMDKQSRTWEGMWSNLMDWFTRVKLMVMNSGGVLDWMKGKLQGILDTLQRMSDDGSLQALADRIGKNLVNALERMWDVGKAVWSFMKDFGAVLQWVHDLFGSWKPVIVGVAAILAGPLIASLVTLTTAIGGLGLAMLSPGILGFAAVLGAVALAVIGVTKAWNAWKKTRQEKTSIEQKDALLARGGSGAMAAPMRLGAYGSGAANRVQTNNAAVTVDFKNVPAGVSVRPGQNTGVPFKLNVGPMMATP